MQSRDKGAGRWTGAGWISGWTWGKNRAEHICERGNTKRFTLIGLLVVIAIIAILASLMLPALTKAQHKAQQITCAGNMKQMGMAVQMYAGDFNGFSPLARRYGGIPQKNWYSRTLPPYLGEGSISNPMGYDYSDSLDVVVCPSANPEWGRWHYLHHFAWGHARLHFDTKPSYYAGIPLEKLRHPTKLAMYVEAEPYMNAYGKWGIEGYLYYGLCRYPDRKSGYAAMKPYMHGTGMNVTFADGHVGFVPSGEAVEEYSKGYGPYYPDEEDATLFWDAPPAYK